MTRQDENDRCGACGADVIGYQPGVRCDKCECWHHTGCFGINQDIYRRMQWSEEEWVCSKCKQPKGNIGNTWIIKQWYRLKVGTLYCRGLKRNGGYAKQTHIAEDVRRYHLEILALQETHMGGEETEEIETAD